MWEAGSNFENECLKRDMFESDNQSLGTLAGRLYNLFRTVAAEP